MRLLPTAAMIISMSFAAGMADARCDVCSLKFQHRAGPFEVLLRSTKDVYRVGDAVNITVSIVNRGTKTLYVDPDAELASLSFHVIAPNYKATQPDRPLPAPRSRAIAPGQRFTFREIDLKQAAITTNRAGEYLLNVSYDRVDSNVLRIVMRPH